uniref:Ubiquitin thioesterase OTU n=1 Tax=Tetradesmus obliquus TaxID=3088 RepID=A0A383VKG3_TETOB
MHSNAQPKRSRQPTLSSLPRPQAERADVITRSSPTDSTSSSSALPLQQQRPTRFAKYGITGDGSCMFRACVQGHHQLQHGGQQLPAAAEYSKALALRQAVVEELRKNRELSFWCSHEAGVQGGRTQRDMEPFLPGIADDFDDYLAKMAQPGVWGGEPELLMASRVLQRPIAVYQAAWGGPQYILTYGEEFEIAAAPMHLLWSGSHYDLLLPQPASKL